jgi:hypothetical protein
MSWYYSRRRKLMRFFPGGWSTTGQRVSTKKPVQIRRLFVQVGLLSLVTFSGSYFGKAIDLQARRDLAGHWGAD